MKKGTKLYPVSKKQFKLWLEESEIDRLNKQGERFGRGSAQQVVEELITLYLPVWVSVNTAMDRAIQSQTLQRPPLGKRLTSDSEHRITMPRVSQKERKAG